MKGVCSCVASLLKRHVLVVTVRDSCVEGSVHRVFRQISLCCRCMQMYVAPGHRLHKITVPPLKSTTADLAMAFLGSAKDVQVSTDEQIDLERNQGPFYTYCV